jgi:hypothetical protein
MAFEKSSKYTFPDEAGLIYMYCSLTKRKKNIKKLLFWDLRE